MATQSADHESWFEIEFWANVLKEYELANRILIFFDDLGAQSIHVHYTPTAKFTLNFNDLFVQSRMLPIDMLLCVEVLQDI
jgi:hypothetical protein